MTFEAKLKGFDKLEKRLIALSNDVGPAKARTTLNKPLKDALQSTQSLIESTTPVDTGELRKTIKTNSGRANKKELSSGVFTKNDVAVARTGYFWSTKSHWFQALALEYGTSQMAPKRILRNAIESTKRIVLQDLGRGLSQSINKRVQRFTKTGK